MTDLTNTDKAAQAKNEAVSAPDLGAKIPGVLCYVEGNRAYFTTAPLSEQWGDDWDDAPYEHNAETPYEKDGITITTVMFDGPFRAPMDGHTNSPYSVQAINAGAIPWLRPEPWEKQMDHIKAGATFSEFKGVIEKFGGHVYLPLDAIGNTPQVSAQTMEEAERYKNIIDPPMQDGCGKINRATFEKLMAENKEWLLKQPRTLERDHISAMIDAAPMMYYQAAIFAQTGNTSPNPAIDELLQIVPATPLQPGMTRDIVADVKRLMARLERAYASQKAPVSDRPNQKGPWLNMTDEQFSRYAELEDGHEVGVGYNSLPEAMDALEKKAAPVSDDDRQRASRELNDIALHLHHKKLGAAGSVIVADWVIRNYETIRSSLAEPRPNPLAGITPICGFSSNGINVWGDKKSMDAVRTAFHDQSQINEWRDAIRRKTETEGV